MFHRTSCTVSSQGRFLLSWPRIIFTIAQNSPLGEQTVVYFFPFQNEISCTLGAFRLRVGCLQGTQKGWSEISLGGYPCMQPRQTSLPRPVRMRSLAVIFELCLSESGLLKMRRLELDSPVVRYKSVNVS